MSPILIPAQPWSPDHCLDGPDRIAADAEEVVVATNPLLAEQLLPDTGQHFLALAQGRFLPLLVRTRVPVCSSPPGALRYRIVQEGLRGAGDSHVISYHVLIHS